MLSLLRNMNYKYKNTSSKRTFRKNISFKNSAKLNSSLLSCNKSAHPKRQFYMATS